MSSICYNDYCHVTPGRVRVRVTNLKNNREAAKSLQVLMVSQPGVTHVCANPVTGNVLINYDNEVVSCEDVLRSLADLGHYPSATKKVSGVQSTVPASDSQLSELGMRIAKIALKHALSGSPVAILLELL